MLSLESWSIGLCGETGNMIKVIPLDQISQITVFSHWQLTSIRVVSTSSSFTIGRDSSIITVHGIADAEEFVAAVLNQMRVVKNRRREYVIEPSTNA